MSEFKMPEFKMPETIQNAPTVMIGRRKLLLGGAGAIGLALVAAACGSDKDSSTTTPGTTVPGSGTPTTMGGTGTTMAPTGGGDLAIAQLAAGLEVLAVGTYQAALDAAGKGALGDVPPAVGEYVTTALAHHQAHLDAWNKVITGAGGTAVTEPNSSLKPTVDAEFAKVTDVAGAATLALTLEDIAAQTYLSTLDVLESKDAVKLAGSIQIIDQQHQAILLFALGMYPVPASFQSKQKAVAA